jgi:hypothetical protein
MRTLLLALSFLIPPALTGTGSAGCGDNHPGSAGAAGSGGSSGGGAGSVGTAGGAGGAAGAGGGAGNATGTGGATAHSPEEIHDSLINAQTTGGIEVTRTSPAFAPPACQ